MARGGAGFINQRVLRISTRIGNALDMRNYSLGFRSALGVNGSSDRRQ